MVALHPKFSDDTLTGQGTFSGHNGTRRDMGLQTKPLSFPVELPMTKNPGPPQNWHHLLVRRLLRVYAATESAPCVFEWQQWFTNRISEYGQQHDDHQSLRKKLERFRNGANASPTSVQHAFILKGIVGQCPGSPLGSMDATLDDNEFFEQFVKLASDRFTGLERTQLQTATREDTEDHIEQLIERAFLFVTNVVEEAVTTAAPTADTAPHSIPAIGAFHGREEEIKECHRRLNENKVMEVMGMSGIGKTRLLLTAINERLADGRIAPDGFLYFDCAVGMRTENAADVFFSKLGGFAKRGGCSEADYVTVLSPNQSVTERVAVVVRQLKTVRCLLFIDNFQDALDATGRLVSPTFKEAIDGLINAEIGESRVVIGTYLKWSEPHRVDPDQWEFPMVSPADAKLILKEMCSLKDEALLEAAVDIAAGHTYTLRLFVALADGIGEPVSTVVNDLASKKDHYAASEFQKVVGEAFMNNLWSPLSLSTRKLLSAAAVVRQPTSFEFLKRISGLESDDARGSKTQAIKCYLLEPATSKGLHSIHQLVRAHALRVVEPETLKQLHQAAADTFRDSYVFGSAMDGIEAHYHLMQYDEVKAEAYRGSLAHRLDEVGKQSWSRQLYEEALKGIDWRLAFDPDDASAIRHKANTLARLGLPEASDWYRRALERGDKLSHVWTAYARLSINKGNVDLAEHFLALARKNDPTNSRILKDLAQVRLLLGNPLSNEEWEAAIKVDPKKVALRNMYATELRKQGHGNLAIEQWNLAIKLARRNPFAYTQLADYLSSIGRTEEAVALWEQCCELVKTDAAVRNDYARYLKKSDPQRAIELWKEAIALGSGHAMNDYALFLAANGDGSEAETVWRAAIKQDANNPVHRNNLARYLADLGSVQEAEKLWLHNTRENPLHTHSRNNYAAFLERAKRIEDADAQWRASVEVDPGAEHGRNGYALFLLRQKKVSEAEAQWALAAKDVMHVAARNAWANFLIRRSRNSALPFNQRKQDRLKAIALWEEVRRVSPYEPFMVSDYSACLQRPPSPNRALAEELLAGALKDDPDNERFLHNYARLLMAKGPNFFAAAKVQYEHGIKIKPESPRFRGGYATLLDNAGDTKGAWEQLTTGLYFEPDNWHLLHIQSRFHEKGYPFPE